MLRKFRELSPYERYFNRSQTFLCNCCKPLKFINFAIIFGAMQPNISWFQHPLLTQLSEALTLKILNLNHFSAFKIILILRVCVLAILIMLKLCSCHVDNYRIFWCIYQVIRGIGHLSPEEATPLNQDLSFTNKEEINESILSKLF